MEQQKVQPSNQAAKEGAKQLVEAAQIYLGASYADDHESRTLEMNQARQLEGEAYKKLATVDIEQANALIATERNNVSNDGQLKELIRLDEVKFAAAAKELNEDRKPTATESALADGKFTGEVISSNQDTVTVRLEAPDQNGNTIIYADNEAGQEIETGTKLNLTDAIKNDGVIRETEIETELEENSIEEADTHANQTVDLNFDEEVRGRVASAWARKAAPQVEVVEQETEVKPFEQTEHDDPFSDTALTNDNPSRERDIVKIPPQVEADYLRVGSKFYYPSRPDQVAFEDKESRLSTKSNSQQVAATLVEIAEARGWKQIKVTGTEDFKRQAWLAAQLKGLDVKGYTPKDTDKALLQKAQAELPDNAIEAIKAQTKQQASQEKIAPKASQSSAISAAPAEVKQDPIDRLKGELLDHGAAHFNFDKKEKESYYVKLRNNDGQEKTVWGIDLRRAVAESNAQIGDNVSLENKGKTAVTVNSPVRDKDGNVVSTKTIDAVRNAWEVKTDVFKNQDRAAAVEKHPDLVNAYATLSIAEKVARERYTNEADVRQFVDIAKDKVAAHIEAGKEIPQIQVQEKMQVNIKETLHVRERIQEQEVGH